MNALPEIDRKNVIERYSKRFSEFGYSPKTLGWDKGKQDIRLEILTSLYNFSNKSVLDIGCGFGDLNKVLSHKYNDYRYLGIDLVDELVEIGRKLYGTSTICFEKGDFLEKDITDQFDYIIASGIFNFKIANGANYDFIESVIKKALSVCIDGLAFDFLSDKVDYQYEHTFHSSPETILSMAYKYSRNVVLRNDYMPFEFSLFIFKDDSFSKEDTIFRRYKHERGN